MEAEQVQTRLRQFQTQRPDYMRRLAAQLGQRSSARSPLLSIFGRSYYQWRYRRRLSQAMRTLEQLEESQRQQLEQLFNRERELDRQIEVLETARRLLRFWHIFHVPIGLTLFFSAAVHVIATLYFRAGLFK